MTADASSPPAPELRAAATLLAARFDAVITAFLPAIGLFQRWFQPHVLTVYNRFARARRRLASVMARLAAGKLKTRVRAPRQRAPREQIRLPQGRGWLHRAFAKDTARLHVANFHRIQLETLLNEPGFAPLLATPQAARILRPLCRMLGLAVPSLPKLPPRKPRAPKPRKPRRLTRAEHQAILWYPNHEGKPMQLLPPRRKSRPS
jgi:hypothetical protein